ncbi:hypothetical protein BROUX41_006670 [Berkeleyomyces rouxiae]|uniref:uncharacterized protein n=1 Tax=Berkeleyomyces rouxiae TaxID=2035830 RepID=UPI003B7C0C83
MPPRNTIRKAIRPPGSKLTKQAANPRPTRIRSFGGCFTCRSRKVKCDEIHPLCNQCQASGLQCAGYEAKVRFILFQPNTLQPNSDQGERDGGHGRRILFTEYQRQGMSEHMKKLVHTDEFDALLNKLESELQQDSNPSSAVHSGPFYIFKVAQPGHNLSSDQSGSAPSTRVPVSPSQAEPNSILGNSRIIYQSEGHLETLSDYTSKALASVPSSWLACEQALLQPDHIDDDHSHLARHDSLALSSSASTNYYMQPTAPSPLDAPIPDSLASTLDSSSIWQFQFLLNHYKSQMNKIFSPLRARKPPWSILHFPRALSAFSELAVFRHLSHAHISIFYAVLAVSAFNWDNIHRSEGNWTDYWRATGKCYWLGAKHHLGMAGEVEVLGERKTKYKDILMSTLAMVTIAVVTGQQNEARSFLLNAELFICLRGIPKARKSRNLKLLHCIYLFLRVIEESTYIYPLDRPPLGNLSIPLDNMLFPSLRTNSLCVGRDLDQQCGMNFERGLFSDPGAFEKTPHPTYFFEIYGIPHELLSFISRTTFLANEMCLSERNPPGFTVTFDLQDACNKLDAEICGWKYFTAMSQNKVEDPLSSFANQNIMPHLILAFHNAVLIYFYRRIRRVHPLMLQHWVEMTLNELELYEQKQHDFSIVNCGVVWPMFIAGAEAMDEILQARFLKKLHEDAKTSGMWNFELAASILAKLWKLRRESDEPFLTWMDFVRERRLSLVMT